MGSDKAVAGVSFPRGGGPGKVLSEGAADGSGAGTDGLPPGFEELRRQSPLALPPVSPNGGTGGGFQYPTPEPEVAAPVAGMENASAEAPPWATSVAVVLATLLAAVHLGIWVRRNRLFVPAPAGGRAGKGHGSRSRRPVTARSGGAARSPGSAVRWIPGRGAPRGVSEQASTGGSEEHRSGDSSERDEPGSLTSRPQPAAVRLADTAEQDRRRRN